MMVRYVKNDSVSIKSYGGQEGLVCRVSGSRGRELPLAFNIIIGFGGAVYNECHEADKCYPEDCVPLELLNSTCKDGRAEMSTVRMQLKYRFWT